MRMNKKLKNVLAVGLAVSCVLSSAVGTMAEEVNLSVFSEEANVNTKTLTVIFWDVDKNCSVGANAYLNHTFAATDAEDATHEFAATSVTVPEGYVVDYMPSLILHRDWPYNTATVDVKEANQAPTPTETKKTLTVNFWDVDSNKEVGDKAYLDYTFAATEAADATYEFAATSVTVPEGYVVETVPSLIVHRDWDYNTATVYVKKENPAPAPTETKKTLTVNFWDVDSNSEVGDKAYLDYTFAATEAADATHEFPATSVTAPEGYVVDKMPPLIVHRDWDYNTATVDVKKKNPAPVPTETKKTLTVNFWDVDSNSEVGDKVYLDYTFAATDAADATYEFAATSVTAPVGYVVEKIPALIVHRDWDYNTATVDVKKESPAPVPTETKKTLTVNFWDVDSNSEVGDKVYLDYTFAATDAADATYEFAATAVTAPAGYVAEKIPSLIVHRDWEYNTATVDVKKVASETEKRTVTVNFTVDATKGQFTDPAGAKVVTYENIDEFSDQQFLIPSVEAFEGYKFVGWKGQGASEINWGAGAETFGVTGLAYFAEGSNVGYASIEAVFEEVVQETEKRTVTVNFNVDPEKGKFTDPAGAKVVTYENIDEFSDQQFLIPSVEAFEGYKFVGWKGQGASEINWSAGAMSFGVTGLAYFAEGSNVGYASIEAVFEAVETETETETTAPTETETETETTAPTETETETETTAPTESETETETTAPTESETETETEEETETAAPAEDETETETDEKAAATEKKDNNDKKDDSKNAGNAVATGDTTVMVPYVIAMFAAAVAIVVLALKKRKTI